MSASMPMVALPCQDRPSWGEDKNLFAHLSSLRSLQEYSELVASHTRGDPSPLRSRLERFPGLLVYLEKYCTEEERAAFFEQTLPFICEAAACLEDRVPEGEVPFLRRQESASLVLGRKLVVSLLANAFLCTFPESGEPQQQQQQQQQEEKEEEGKLFPFSFSGLYTRLLKSTKKTPAIAAKLKCMLVYFHRLAENKCGLNGTITVKRKVLPDSEAPSLTLWQASQCPLCSISVDNSRGIEDAGSHTLQVDFANRCMTGSTLEGGCVQEEIRFAICPELLVSRLVVDVLDHNEAVVITGAERFANYKGYGQTLRYTGEHVDQSDRDVFGNVLTSIVAIDAVPFLKSLSPEQQYTDHYLLRELNKAFSGFLCQQDRGDFSAELITLRVQNVSTHLAHSENRPCLSPSSVSSDSSESSAASHGSNHPPPSASRQQSKSITEPLSPIKEVSESPIRSLPTQPPAPTTVPLKMSPPKSKSAEPFQISGLISSIVSSGIKMAADHGGASELREEAGKSEEMQSPVSTTALKLSPPKSKSAEPFQISGLVSSIVSSGIKMAANYGGGGASEPTKEEAGRAEKEREQKQKVVDNFATKLSESLLSSIVTQSAKKTEDVPKGDAKSEASKMVAEKLTNSLFLDIHFHTTKKETSKEDSRDDSEEDSGDSGDDSEEDSGDSRDDSGEDSGDSDSTSSQLAVMADNLARSIISDVLSYDGTVPSTPPSSPQTVGQPTSPAVAWRVHSFADEIADSIISSVLYTKEQPAIVIYKQNESVKSSRSSSLTGQTITLHEFTDDMIEGVMREGMFIASLQSRGVERAHSGEGDKERGGRGGGRKKEGGGRDVSDFAELLVAQSIQSVLGDGRKTSKTSENGEKEKTSLKHSPGGTRRAESPMRPGKPGLLRQALDKPKFTSLTSEPDLNELEHSTSGSLLHLAAPSSRMSYAWSVASTRDEESRPVSPTDLDRMALSFVGSIEEYCSMFAELVIRSAIAEVTGNKEYFCHVPTKFQSNSDSMYSTGDVRIQVPTGGYMPSTHGSRLDNFLSTLDEAEPLAGGEVEGGESEQGLNQRSQVVQKALLRPVATGNWGCGAFGGDPQLKSMLQWAAVSAAERPEMMYFPFSDKRMEQFTQVTSHLHTKQWTVGQLLTIVIKFCQLSKEEREQKSLFSQLLEQ